MPTSGNTRGRRAGLTRAIVADGALRVIDRDGLDGLTMRRVGEEVGVQAMSLYNHVADKDDLLDAVAERVVAAVPPVAAGLSWDDALRALARGLRAAVLAHPHAAPLIASRPLGTQAALAPIEAMLAALRRAGLAPAEAVAAFWLVTSYLSGSLAAEAAAATERRATSIGPTELASAGAAYPTLTELAPFIAASDYAVEFDRGLEHLIATVVPSR